MVIPLWTLRPGSQDPLFLRIFTKNILTVGGDNMDWAMEIMDFVMVTAVAMAILAAIL